MVLPTSSLGIRNVYDLGVGMVLASIREDFMISLTGTKMLLRRRRTLNVYYRPVSMLQFVAKYSGCNQYILTSPLEAIETKHTIYPIPVYRRTNLIGY